MKKNTIKFETHGDDQGTLVSIEGCRNIPFQIKRVYYAYDTKDGVIRGRHAHRLLQQILICIHGNCKVMLDDGKERKIVTLDQPNMGIYITSGIWREVFDFSPDAVLMVLASELYNESDYIRDYDEFLEYIKTHKDR